MAVIAKSKDGNKLKADKKVVQICRELLDSAPINCFSAATSAASAGTGLNREAPINMLQECAHAVGSGEAATNSSVNFIVADCIKTMAALINPSAGLSANEAIKFCALSQQHGPDYYSLLASAAALAAGGGRMFANSTAAGGGRVGGVAATATAVAQQYAAVAVVQQQLNQLQAALAAKAASPNSAAAECFAKSGNIKDLAAGK
jgi:hypothetical protein